MLHMLCTVFQFLSGCCSLENEVCATCTSPGESQKFIIIIIIIINYLLQLGFHPLAVVLR
jgi:hypothetical protein